MNFIEAHVEETRARSVNYFLKLALVDTFSGWRLILYWLIVCGKSFKGFVDGFS